jgi:plastocyanin/ribosomal protein L37E
MKKALLLALAIGLLVAAPAPAKTVTVDISKLGFVPAAVTVQAGDSVTWTNKDTVNHQVVCATCTFTSLVLAPGQSHTFVFTKVGKFTTVDPLNKNKKGTVTVTAAPASLTLTAAPRAVTYGHATTVSGTLSTGQANQKVDILAQPCGEKAAKVITSVTTTTGGAFTYQAQPAMLTSYQAQFKPNLTSSAVSVSVRPTVTLRRLARNKFSVQVNAAESFVGKAVAFQRYVSAKRRWNTVKTVFLGTRAAAATPLAGTTVSSVTFSAKLKSGLRVRAVLPPGQTAPCYSAAKSATIRS